MTCPTCHKPAHSIRTAIRDGKLITTCEHCSHRQQPHALAAANRRQQQGKDYAKDIVQPTDARAYSKAYPEEARKIYGDDRFRKLS